MAEKKKTSGSGSKSTSRADTSRSSSARGSRTTSRAASGSAKRPAQDNKPAQKTTQQKASSKAPEKKSAPGKSSASDAASKTQQKTSSQSVKAPENKPAQKSAASGSRRSSSAKKTGSGKKKNVGYAVSLLRADDDRSKIIRTCIKLFLVLLLVIAIIGLWRNRVDWSCTNISQCAKDSSLLNGSGEGFPLSVLGSRVISEEELSGGIAVLTDTTLTVYGSSSKQAVSRAHYLSTPALRTAGHYALLFDIGGTKYRLETVSDTLITGTAQYPLIGGAAARNGDFALITQGSEYASCFSSVEVFNAKGTSIYRWDNSEFYITGAALSADGKYLAVCGVSAKDGGLLSCVMIRNVRTNGELARYELPDSTCFSVGFTNTGTLFAICDNKVLTSGNYGNSMEEFPINGTLQAYDISYDCGAAIYESTGTGDDAGMLTLFDSRGDKRTQKEIPMHGISLSLGENGCCLLGRGGITAIRLSGEAIGSWDAEVSAADILIIGSRAYVVEGISISQIKMNKAEETAGTTA